MKIFTKAIFNKKNGFSLIFGVAVTEIKHAEVEPKNHIHRCYSSSATEVKLTFFLFEYFFDFSTSHLILSLMTAFNNSRYRKPQVDFNQNHDTMKSLQLKLRSLFTVMSTQFYSSQLARIIATVISTTLSS